MVMGVLVMLLGLSGWSAASDSQHRRSKSVFPEPAPSSLINIVRSSLVFPLHGNVYPMGYVQKILPKLAFSLKIS